jgi:hypothetical protein
MANIVIFMKDGRKKEFMHEGRPGGSYTKTIQYVPGFVIITDEWGEQTSIPTEDIKEIKTTPNR